MSINYFQSPPDSSLKVNYTYHPGSNFPPEIAEELYFQWNSSASLWDTAYKYIYTDSSFGGTLSNPHPSRKKTKTLINYNGFTNVWVNGNKFVEVWRDIDWINWEKTEEVWYNWDITDNAWIPNVHCYNHHHGVLLPNSWYDYSRPTSCTLVYWRFNGAPWRVLVLVFHKSRCCF